jgi:hypothetical protein
MFQSPGAPIYLYLKKIVKRFVQCQAVIDFSSLKCGLICLEC